MKYNYGKCECCGREYPLGKLDDDGNCEHCIEYHNLTDLDTDDHFNEHPELEEYQPNEEEIHNSGGLGNE